METKRQTQAIYRLDKQFDGDVTSWSFEEWVVSASYPPIIDTHKSSKEVIKVSRFHIHLIYKTLRLLVHHSAKHLFRPVSPKNGKVLTPHLTKRMNEKCHVISRVLHPMSSNAVAATVHLTSRKRQWLSSKVATNK